MLKAYLYIWLLLQMELTLVRLSILTVVPEGVPQILRKATATDVLNSVPLRSVTMHSHCFVFAYGYAEYTCYGLFTVRYEPCGSLCKHRTGPLDLCLRGSMAVSKALRVSN